MWRVFYSIAATVNTVTWGIYFSFTRRYIGVELEGGIKSILLITGLEWLYAFSALASSRVTKFISRRSGILLGSLGSIPLLVSIFIRDPTGLAAVLSLTSLTWYLTWPLVMSTVFSGAEGRFGRAYSFFTIGMGFGFSVGSLVMGLLYYAGGASLVFAACSILYTSSYIIFFVFYPNSREVLGEESGGSALLTVRSLVPAIVAYALLVFCREAYYSVAPVILSGEIAKILPDISERSQYVAFGILYGGLTSFLSVPTRILVGYLVDRYDPRSVLLASFILYVSNYWLFISLGGLATIVIWQLPLYPVADTSINVLLAKSSTRDGRTQALGVGLAFSAIGGLGVLPLTAYPDLDPVSVGVVITSVAALGVAILVGAVSYGMRPRRAAPIT
ncbi:MAG: MFS transporter [Sulfolobales archaeon]|nr:MFS transporter [Sulfolobales archaeon]MCX8209008.1 MFS transporter [Sulfolobales archaeon]MDW8010020.1 MFS transporter [Sulfolobales archaeon]